MFLTWLTILIGLVICLGIFGWMFAYFVRVPLDNEDSVRIDPIPKENEKY